MSDPVQVPFLNGLQSKPDHKDEDLAELRRWLETQPHLPRLSDDYLHLFLHSCYSKLERTKHTIENYFTIRSNNTELFSKWDPTLPPLQRMYNVGLLTMCSRQTPEGYSVLLYRLAETESSKFDFNTGVKLFFMFNDMILSEVGFSPGFVVVFDMKGIGLAHLTTVNISSIRTFMNYIQEAHPARLRGVHVINSVSFIDKVLGLIKPFIKSELMNMVHFHGVPGDTLNKYLPLDTLPADYGGKSEETVVLHEKYKKLMVTRYPPYFERLTSMKVDETKRVKVKRRCRLFGGGGAEPSFRTLSID